MRDYVMRGFSFRSGQSLDGEHFCIICSSMRTTYRLAWTTADQVFVRDGQRYVRFLQRITSETCNGLCKGGRSCVGAAAAESAGFVGGLARVDATWGASLLKP